MSCDGGVCGYPKPNRAMLELEKHVSLEPVTRKFRKDPNPTLFDVRPFWDDSIQGFRNPLNDAIAQQRRRNEIVDRELARRSANDPGNSFCEINSNLNSSWSKETPTGNQKQNACHKSEKC